MLKSNSTVLVTTDRLKDTFFFKLASNVGKSRNVVIVQESRYSVVFAGTETIAYISFALFVTLDLIKIQ